MNREQLEKIYDKIEEDEADCWDVKRRVEELEVTVKNELKEALWREYKARRT